DWVDELLGNNWFGPNWLRRQDHCRNRGRNRQFFKWREFECGLVIYLQFCDRLGLQLRFRPTALRRFDRRTVRLQGKPFRRIGIARQPSDLNTQRFEHRGQMLVASEDQELMAGGGE